MFKSERNFDMAQFGWTDCKFTFNALTWGEMRSLEKARQKWGSAEDQDVEKAANEIVDIMKSKFIRGEALDDKNEKVPVTVEQFEEVPFDIFLKLVAWLTSGEVDEGFLAS